VIGSAQQRRLSHVIHRMRSPALCR
jgi:hypothetical protein